MPLTEQDGDGVTEPGPQPARPERPRIACPHPLEPVALRYLPDHRLDASSLRYQPARLDAWIAAASASGVAALGRCAQGLLPDIASVRAGLTRVWSNEQTARYGNETKPWPG